MLRDNKSFSQTSAPLVSICMLCYNHEQYIEASVRAILAQTYSRLEIVVSDDCSTDNTWNILQRIKEEYTGPHTFIIRRNEHNLRIIRNFCTAFKMAMGNSSSRLMEMTFNFPTALK